MQPIGPVKICSFFHTTVPEDAGIEPRTVAVFALTVELLITWLHLFQIKLHLFHIKLHFIY
jgi:hypothetical protein